jgi:hypothetical protein
MITRLSNTLAKTRELVSAPFSVVVAIRGGKFIKEKKFILDENPNW